MIWRPQENTAEQPKWAFKKKTHLQSYIRENVSQLCMVTKTLNAKELEPQFQGQPEAT